MKINNRAIDSRCLNRLLYGATAALVLAAAGPALAQEDDQLPEEVTMDEDLPQEGADVVVDQAAPTVIVEQPKPTVTVTIPPPDISIRQPAPTIRVIMPEPEVSINQAQPQVEIQMPEPKIRIEQAEPEVQVNRAPTDILVTDVQPQVQVQSAGDAEVLFEQVGRPTVTVEQAKPNVIIETTPQLNEALISMPGEEIVGRQLLSSDQQPLGRVSNLVVDKQSKRLFAVVEVGDAAPGDVSVIVIPLQQIRLAQDQLRAGLTPQQITPDMAYDQGQYQPIKLSVPLREYAVIGQ